MCEACTELDARLEAVVRLAAPLPARLPRVRDPVLGRWMAQQLDTLQRNVAAGRSACDAAVAEGLDALDVGRRAMDLKYSNIGDYAREELGINASTAPDKLVWEFGLRRSYVAAGARNLDIDASGHSL